MAKLLESLQQSVSGTLSDLDRMLGIVAAEADLTSALSSASEERRRTGPGAVEHGGAVVTAAGLPTGTSPDAVVISPQPPPSMPLTTSPIANHNLIAGDNPDNQTALFDMLREIQR